MKPTRKLVATFFLIKANFHSDKKRNLRDILSHSTDIASENESFVMEKKSYRRSKKNVIIDLQYSSSF